MRCACSSAARRLLVGPCLVGLASIWARKLHGLISEKVRFEPKSVTFSKDILLHVILASNNLIAFSRIFAMFFFALGWVIFW